MAEKSTEKYYSLKGNDKAISILQNVIRVMVLFVVFFLKREMVNRNVPKLR